MRGRIKRKQALIAGAYPRLPNEQSLVCPLCGRAVPGPQADAHHLVPKSRGGVETVILHRICHRQVHAVLSEAELEGQYATIESLRGHPELSRFLAWVKNKPNDFYERTRKSNRLKVVKGNSR